MAKTAGHSNANRVWIITTFDGKVAVSAVTETTYQLGVNQPGSRKEWKSERGAREALRRIRRVTVGGTILYAHRISLD